MQKTSKNKFISIVLITFFVFGLFTFNTFEGGSCAGVTWTYNSSTNTATASGTGSTNFAALVAADTAGGWGKYTADATGTQIICRGKIIFGDGTNALTFTDTAKQVLFTANVRNGGNTMYVANNAIVTFGAIQDATTKTTKTGIQFTDLSSTSGYFILPASDNANNQINFYGCSIYGATLNFESRIQARNIWNCRLQYMHLYYNIYTTGDISNTIIDYGYVGIDVPRVGITTDRLTITSQYASVYFQSAPGTLKNSRILYSGSATDFRLSSMTSDHCYLINVEAPTWDITWTGTSTKNLVRQYTFDLNVLNGEITDFVQNANVTLYKDGSKIYSALTNSSGMIPTQTLTYGYYQQATGNNIQNATSPYYLVVTHPDWQTYVSRFYITEPLRLTVSMQEPTITGYTEAEKSDYTTIILFVISLILCIIGLALTVPLLPLIALTVSVINVLLLTEISVFNILLIILNIIFTVITIVRTKTKNN